MDLQLQDKIIIVTGAAKGIGRAIVKILAREGAIPVIVGRNEKDNQQLKCEIENTGGRCFSITAELTNPDNSAMVINKVMDEFDTIDGLVNNAGQNDGVGLENGNYADFMLSLHKNVVHYYLLAHFALPFLKASRGVILNIGSKTAETGQGGTSAYAASNGARNALTREWAVELLPFSIRVNSIIVAECWTPLYESWLNSKSNPDQRLAEIKMRIPLENRMTTVDEIAHTAAFLLSNLSSHTTGQLIHVDGGYVHLDRALNKTQDQ